jgi:hypothetical protein
MSPVQSMPGAETDPPHTNVESFVKIPNPAAVPSLTAVASKMRLANDVPSVEGRKAGLDIGKRTIYVDHSSGL